MTSFRPLAFFAVLILVIASVAKQVGASTGDFPVNKTAQQFISDFRAGGEFNSNDNVSMLVPRGQVNREALAQLTRELENGSPTVRANIVKLLEKVGLELDSSSTGKLPIIRDHSVIRALLVEAFAKDDAAASAAEAVLRGRCRPDDLAAFSDVFIKSLRQLRGDYLYLIAKAKVGGARPLVDELAKSGLWATDIHRRPTVEIVQAALGDLVRENEFIAAVREAEREAPPAPKNRFYDVGLAKDGTEVAKALHTLGLIGTKRALQVVCNFLRSPLKSYVPNIRERSVRYDALEALRYNFPDEEVLLKPKDAEEWAAAERFCTDRLGVSFDGPTPDLPPDLPYPTRLR
jgi:hypothetical protein